MELDPAIREYYERGLELSRLTQGYSRVEFARTKELLERHFPPPPARMLDVGGGPGLYAEWLADVGYEVVLVDPVDLHVAHAEERAAGRFDAKRGDARELDEPNDSFDVVLLLGPLYHLIERHDRLLALREARRVVRVGGLVAAAAISRLAPLLDGLTGTHMRDERVRELMRQTVAAGVHRAPPDRPDLFTTSYFHRPDELAAELTEAGLRLSGVFGVEGPGWFSGAAVGDEGAREDVLYVARQLEQEPTAIGTSAHLLALARR